MWAQSPVPPIPTAQNSSYYKDSVSTSWYLNDSTLNYYFDTESNVWKLTNKVVNSFSGRYYSKIDHYYQDTNNTLLIYEERTVRRDSLHRIIVQIQKEQIGNQLFPTFKDTITYLGNTELPTEDLSFKYDSTTNTWENFFKVINGYDENGMDTTRVEMSWQNNQWLNEYKYYYAYDTNKALIEVRMFSWNGYNWQFSAQKYFTYDQNGNLIECRFYQYNSLTDQFDEYYRENLGYNSDNQMIYRTRRTLVAGQLIPMDSSVYSYDNKLWVSDTTYGWKDSWIYKQVKIYEYNDNNDKVSLTTKSWDYRSEQWKNYYKYTFSYSLNKPIDQCVSPQEIFGNLKSIPDEMIFYSWYNDAWLASEKTDYFYSKYTEWTTADVPVLSVSRLNIYPNPANDYIIVDIGHQPAFGQIINMNGQVVKNAIIISNLLDVSDLPAGIYVIRIKQQGRILLGKFIKN